METLRSVWQRIVPAEDKQAYTPVSLESSGEQSGETTPLRASTDEEDAGPGRDYLPQGEEFSWLVYGVFLLLGVAMLWAWNMFLAAGPYFQRRFRSSPWILKNFQPAELSSTTVVNLAVLILLSNLQAKASYPKRIISALLLNVLSFTLLAMSTKLFVDVTAETYFAFLIVAVLIAALATGLFQNGIFAYVSGFGREEYMQGTMTGQAVAGVAPCIVQIVSVLSSPAANAGGPNSEVPTESSNAALAYFLTATAISVLTLAAFLGLTVYRESDAYQTILNNRRQSISAGMPSKRAVVPLRVLAYKLRWLASSVAIIFAITLMIFPVYTQRILSTHPAEDLPRYLEPSTFIPLAFLLNALGDLVGRLMAAVPGLRISHRPVLTLSLALTRIIWLPLYMLCNVDGNGAIISSDLFYLVIVQFSFGLSNGFISTSCMMGATDYVEPEEREAAGGFMGLALVVGLAIGSVLSFLFA